MLKNVVYQVYPKSFQDNSGDGHGDLKGLYKRLDYIKSLGVTYIWITPFYKSPQNDNGYDVEDYYNVDPKFGTNQDIVDIINRCAELNIKVMLDMVFNHSSTSHEWFQKALGGSKKYQDYYIFNKNKTSWESKFGGNAWEYVPKLDKYYLHLFDKSQADLNWENPELRNEIYRIVNYWIDKGVKGFRFDVINLISKTYPLVDGINDGRNQYTDGPRVHEFLKELRHNTFGSNIDFLTVGEMSSTTIQECVKYASPTQEELHTVFHFHHLKTDYKNGEKWTRDYFDFLGLKQILSKWQLSMDKDNCVDALFWSNHDQPRVASRFTLAGSRQSQVRKNKMLAASMYLLKGVSYIYQGEEIGMENLSYDSIEEFKDIESINYSKGKEPKEALKILKQKSRDNGRSPMQWDSSVNGGFSSGNSWLKINDNYREINVEAQIDDQDSVLNFYKKIIDLKLNDDIFIYGNVAFKELLHSKLFIFTRQTDSGMYTVICNYFDEYVSYELPKDVRVVLSNTNRTTISNKVKPYELIVLKNS